MARPSTLPGTVGHITTTPWLVVEGVAHKLTPSPCGRCESCVALGDKATPRKCSAPVDPTNGKDRVKPTYWQARARSARLTNGRYVDLVSPRDKGKTEDAAKRALQVLFAERDREAMAPVRLRTTKTLGGVAEDWVKTLEADTRLSPGSKRVYAGTVARHLTGSALAGRLPKDVTPGDIEDHLAEVAKTSGAATAKTLRSVLSKIMARAVRHELAARNVVKEADALAVAGRKVSVKSTVGTRAVNVERQHDRALSAAEESALLESLSHDTTGDLIRFMLAVGVRIGEALAVRWSDVDLEAGTVAITGTITRERGEGLVRGGTKTDLSERIIPLPERTVTMFLKRHAESGGVAESPVFASSAGTFVDPSNMNRLVRRRLDAVGLIWATPHTFRRTVLTRLGDKAIPLRQIADLAGHVDPAMTMRKYLGRRGDNEALRGAL